MAQNRAAKLHYLAYRPMREEDVTSIMAIEKIAYPHPWTEGIFRDCLRAGYTGIIAEKQHAIIGYGLLSIAAGEAHLLNLCITPGERGNGHGKQLLEQLLLLARNRRVKTVFLEVRASNTTAQQLYLNNGFNEIGFRPDYYPNGNKKEDALVFAKTIV